MKSLSGSFHCSFPVCCGPTSRTRACAGHSVTLFPSSLSIFDVEVAFAPLNPDSTAGLTLKIMRCQNSEV